MNIRVIGAVFFIFALTGCANAPAGDPQSEAKVYPFTLEQAKQVIVESLREAIPSREPVAIANGYQSRIRFAIDTHRIRGFYYPAKGKSADGRMVEGYRFTVRHSGTLPITGSTKARRFFAVLHRRAAEIAPPLQ